MTNRREFLKTFGIATLALNFSASLFCAQNQNKKPNIVFILADDMGWSDLGCYGGEINTPNLDKLAEGGIRFTQMHNTAKCFPSRACLLTGLYAQQCNMDKKAINFKNSVTLGEVLQTAGYRTLMTGKHHGTENPYNRGFSRYFGLRDGACNYFNPGKQREGEGKPAQKRPNRAWCIDDKLYEPYTPKEKDFYTTDYFTKYALNYLDEYKHEDRPFFLYLAYNAPHDPLMAWSEDIKKYRGKYKIGYEKIREERDKKQRKLGLFDKSFPQSEAIHKKWEELSEREKDEEDLKMAVYAAMIDRLDWNIGKILDKINELGERENTLVIFASDNGCSAEVVNIPGSGEIGSMNR
jgi:arylsulfatase